MDPSTYRWRPSCWIRIACLIALAACWGCADKLPKFPGSDEYASGMKSLGEGNSRAAVEAFTQSIDIDRQHEMAWFQRAKAHELLGETDLAIADFTSALNLDPNTAAAYCGRGAAYLKKGLHEQAIADLSQAMHMAPNWHEPVSLRAQAKLDTGEYLAAIDDAREAIHLDANCGDDFRTLGLALLSSPDPRPDAAVNCFAQAIQLYKAPSTSPVELAQVYCELGLASDRARIPTRATQAYAEARRLDPNVSQYMVAYGSPPSDPKIQAKLDAAADLSEKGRFEEAIVEYTDVLGMDPQNVAALIGRGAAFLGKHDPTAAVVDLQKAIDLDPKPTKAGETYCLRSRADAELGNAYLAIADATSAIRLKPDYPLAYLRRAVAHWKAGDRQHALADLADALALDQKQPRTYSLVEARAFDLYVEIYESDVSRERAARNWDKAIDSSNQAINRLRGLLGGVQARIDRGKDRLDKDLADQLTSEQAGLRRLQRQLAETYAERGFDRANRHDFWQAAADLDLALKLDAGDAQVWRLCGLTCCQMARTCHDRGQRTGEQQQWQDASQYLRQAISLAPELDRELRPQLVEAQRGLGLPE